jgi:hypothetical protein
MKMKSNDDVTARTESLKDIVRGAKRVLKEPILTALLEQSLLTPAQLETLLIDLVVEDQLGDHISYEEKAAARTAPNRKQRGVSRGAFNRTLQQSRRNVTKCLYTMLLLAYLGLFDFTVFRPFEEVATRIGDYRRIRDVLAGKIELSDEDLESYRAAERSIKAALDELALPLALKSDLSRRKESDGD